MDARRTKKNGLKFFGYKNHAKVDGKSKVITNHDASSANVHDSQKPGELLEGTSINPLLCHCEERPATKQSP